MATILVKALCNVHKGAVWGNTRPRWTDGRDLGNTRTRRKEVSNTMEAHTERGIKAHHGGTYGREESKHRITQDLQQLYANICFIIFCQMTLAICNKASIAQFCSFGSRYPGIVFVKKKTLDHKRTAKSRHSHGLDHRGVMVRTNTVDVRIHSARRTKERPFSNVCKYFIKSFLVQCLSPKI